MWFAILLAGVAFAAPPEIPSETLSSGPIGKRVATTPADLVILYAGEHKGSLETCGCPKRPRGSLARLEAYRQAVGEALLVNAGYWLEDPTGFDGELRADIVEMNAWMARGIGATRWDALNVSEADIPALATMDPAVREGLPLVSVSWDGPGIRDYVIVQRGGQDVLITGISGPSETLGGPGPYTYRNAKEAWASLVEIPAEVDVVVVLARKADEQAVGLARQLPVDVIVSANLNREQLPVQLVKGAVQVGSFYQTMRLGELRLNLSEGVVTGGVDRQIDLDPDIADDPGILALQNEARTAINAVQAGLYAK